MTKRTDNHRPSAINPDEYALIACLCVREAEGGDLGAAEQLRHEREIYTQHMQKTGGRMARRANSGTCHVCGAHAVDVAIFWHQPSNEYIQTGFDCAEKLDMGDARRFRDFRTARKKGEELMVGKRKAEAILRETGLSRAWDLYSQDSEESRELLTAGLDDRMRDRVLSSLSTLNDLVHQLIRRGDLSNPQWELMDKLVRRVADAQAEQDRRDMERERAEPAPEGRTTLTGEVVKVDLYPGYMDDELKMIVKEDRGFAVFVTVPSDLCRLDNGNGRHRTVRRGERVTLAATLTPSDDDALFAFGKRPAKAALIK